MTVLQRTVGPRASAGAGADAFMPSLQERLARARGDLRLGLPVVLVGDGAPWLVLAAEAITPERHAALVAMGPAQLVLSGPRAAALGLGTGSDGVALAADALDLAAVKALSDPLQDGAVPVPLSALPAGPALQAGIMLAKAAQLLPALLAVRAAPPAAAALTVLSAAEIFAASAQLARHLPVSAAPLPMAVSQSGRVHVFRPEDGGTEHYAIEVGRPDPKAGPVLVRLHSACFTGDVLGSLKCDCGPQLRAAMEAMAEAGGGVLLYLNQEGRGIGLANKMRAYALQDRGLDTVEANLHLGFHDDERDFRIGAAMLALMGISAVRLMTNNPAKVAAFAAHGICVVDRAPLRVGQTPQNARYLATKAAKSGHLLT